MENETVREPAIFANIRKSRTFGHIRSLYKLADKSVLDVGCSEGHYLACFGPGSVGVTIIDAHVEVGRKLGLTILNKNVENPDFAMDKKFDFVWANNFFEHMNSPHLFLRKMETCLNQDGKIILGVPVIPYLPFLSYVKRFRGAYASSHVNFFYRKTLIETVRYAGYEVIEARSFFFKNRTLDWLFNFFAPHMYIVAKPNPDWQYSRKRLLSLEGYEDFEG